MQYKDRQPHNISSGNERGMALVLTLMVVAIITAMVVEFAYGVYVSTSSLHNWQTSQKLSLAARSATKLASYLISSGMRDKTQAVFEISQKIPYDNPEGTIALRIEDESAKFNVNKLVDPNKKLNNSRIDALKRLLTHLGMARDISDRIAWWISSEAMPMPESPRPPKGAPLDSVDELLLIPGIDRESYEKLRPYVTIFGDGKININTAPIPVLMTLDAIDESMAEHIVAYRESTTFSDPYGIRQVPGSGFTSPSIRIDQMVVIGQFFRVAATAESGGIIRIIESVLNTNSGNSVMFWKES